LRFEVKFELQSNRFRRQPEQFEFWKSGMGQDGQHNLFFGVFRCKQHL